MNLPGSKVRLLTACLLIEETIILIIEGTNQHILLGASVSPSYDRTGRV